MCLYLVASKKNVLSLVGACVVVSVLLLRLFALHRENNESFLAVVAPAALNAELKHSPHGLNAVREILFLGASSLEPIILVKVRI